MKTRTSPLACTALLLILAACGSRPAPQSASPARNVLSAAEMQAGGYPDAFTTVQSLRPQWLRLRGPSSLGRQGTIKVYLDGSLLGGPESLQQITIRSISTIRYFDGLEATQRWGLDHGQGAIAVSTRTDSRSELPDPRPPFF